jgi:L-ascorbate metabolism protein UlaG (beta-lactamase superfamily)
MRLFKLGHACVRLEADGQVVVVDPGAFTDANAAAGATAVLITHEHADHWTPDQLRATDAPVFTIAAVEAQIRAQAPDVAERVSVVAPGDALDVGVRVEVVGTKHAVIHPELPHFDNSGYLLTVGDTTVFHPGDALTTLPVAPDLLLLPVSAPWLKVSEAIDYGREMAAPRALAIHDAVYSEIGLGVIDGHLKRFLGARDLEYVRLAPGDELGM